MFRGLINVLPSACRFNHAELSISYYANKSRTMEWMKNDDSSLQAEYKRSKFVLFVDKNPLLRRSSTSGYVLPLITNHDLHKTAESLGLRIDPNSSALIDITPMQGGSNDMEEEFIPVFAINLDSRSTDDGPRWKRLGSALNGELVDIRRALFVINDRSSIHLLAKSQSLLRWVHNTKFCTKCASPLKMKFSKASATCTKCEKLFHPTINPVAITVISNDKNDHLLLVRQPRHLPGIYTAVAGFAEIGEPMEETVRREVAEEVGVDVVSITNAGVSQPWPFPEMSLMVGFYATVHGLPEPRIDTNELEDGQWFTRDEVTSAYQNTLELQSNPDAFNTFKPTSKFSWIPPSGPLAHHLIKRWVNGEI